MHSPQIRLATQNTSEIPNKAATVKTRGLRSGQVTASETLAIEVTLKVRVRDREARRRRNTSPQLPHSREIVCKMISAQSGIRAACDGDAALGEGDKVPAARGDNNVRPTCHKGTHSRDSRHRGQPQVMLKVLARRKYEAVARDGSSPCETRGRAGRRKGTQLVHSKPNHGETARLRIARGILTLHPQRSGQPVVENFAATWRLGATHTPPSRTRQGGIVKGGRQGDGAGLEARIVTDVMPNRQGELLVMRTPRREERREVVTVREASARNGTTRWRDVRPQGRREGMSENSDRALGPPLRNGGLESATIETGCITLQGLHVLLEERLTLGTSAAYATSRRATTGATRTLGGHATISGGGGSHPNKGHRMRLVDGVEEAIRRADSEVATRGERDKGGLLNAATLNELGEVQGKSERSVEVAAKESKIQAPSRKTSTSSADQKAGVRSYGDGDNVRS